MVVARSVVMLLDAPEIRRLPFVGEKIARRASEIPQARRCVFNKLQTPEGQENRRLFFSVISALSDAGGKQAAGL